MAKDDLVSESDELEIFIPDGQSINPHDHSNWEGVGVVPGHFTLSEDALSKALAHFETMQG